MSKYDNSKNKVKSQETGVQEKLLKIGKTNPGNVEKKYATRYTL